MDKLFFEQYFSINKTKSCVYEKRTLYYNYDCRRW